MIKKFSFWIVFVLVLSLGAMSFIHWNSIQKLHLRASRAQPLYQRQKIVDSLILSLEKYRRMSSGFRKASPQEIAQNKEKLRSAFAEGVTRLDALDPTPDEQKEENLLNDEIQEFLGVVSRVEPMLFSKDSYVKPEVLALHDGVLETLSQLEKSTNARIASLRLDPTRSESESLIFLIAVSCLVFALVLSVLFRNYVIYVKPLKKLHTYALRLQSGKSVPENPPHFNAIFGEIQTVLNQLSLDVETHMRDRHKFILDIIADLKLPLTLLQNGKFILDGSDGPLEEDKQAEAAESVRRGLAIFSGSLHDLDDIADINRLESRLEEHTVDLSELLLDVSRKLAGPDYRRKIAITVPPIPVWAMIDSARFERVLIQIFSKVMNTLTPEGHLVVSMSHSTQGNFRGVDISIQDSERVKSGRAVSSGPEQDILKHWINEKGLSMALAHKLVRAHGGAITASGVAGMSVAVTVRLPQEKVVSRGLISPPTEDAGIEGRGLFVQKKVKETKIPSFGVKPLT